MERMKMIRTEQHDSNMLKDPHFVSSYDIDEKIYIFFREDAVENINCGKATFSRVARICKNDEGRSGTSVWTSFFKARLNCSVPGEIPFPFDELQSMSDLSFGNHHPTNDPKQTSRILYGVFNTPANSIEGSAVCAFTLADIEHAFMGQFKAQQTTSHAWVPIPVENNPVPHPAQVCVNKSKELTDNTLTFIRNHPLMDRSVNPAGGKPMLIQTQGLGGRFSAIAVDPQVLASTGFYYDVMFVGTTDGRVLKAVNTGKPGLDSSVVIEDIQVLGQHEAIREIKVLRKHGHNQHEKLIIVSKDNIVSMPLHRCGHYKTCRACNFRYIAVQWDKPNTYGDALITGYKVYVNGIVESLLNADQLSYTITHGKWCQEYSFQVQALTASDKMNSKPSEPLVVEWPGARAPALHRLPTHTSANLRVGWEDPYLTEGVKIKHFRVCCTEEDTEKLVTSIGPVHPDTREAEFKHIKKGSYNIYLEVHLYNTSEVICSDYIRLQPTPAPDAPRIAATVVGFDERRQIEKITCDLVNKRDRLIREVGHKLKQIGALTHPMRAEKDRAVIEAAHTLTRVEEVLEDCFTAMDNYTGQLIAHVSWQCPQSNPDIELSGCNVLIDGKQYGNPMHEGVKTVRIKLGTEQPIYKLTMVALTDKPSAASEESNCIDLLSEAFRPFSFYCYHSIHSIGKLYPDQGCCKYQDSIAYERQLAKKLANQGLLKKHVPPPSCSLLDVFEGEYKPLLQGTSRLFPTAIFFWTPWCLPSQKIMSYYAKFARETNKEFNFIAVACNLSGTVVNNRKDLIHMITANGWREDGSIWHATSQCASSIYEASNHIWKNTTGGIQRDANVETESNVDLTDLLGIAGVPTFLFIHQEGYIAWHGRYAAYDYSSFAAFMRHTFSEVTAVPCPVFKCDSCKNDTEIDDNAIETVLGFITTQTPFKHIQIKPRPQSARSDEEPSIFLKRKPKHRRHKGKITVNQRPYSAHSTTYAYLLKSPYMERQTPSPKTHKVLMRPASSKNVQVAYETL